MNNKLCKAHNEPALYCEEDDQQNQVFLCKFCVQEKFKIQNIDDVDNEEKQELQQLKMKFDQNIKQLKNFAEVLEQFTQYIQQKLKKFKQLVKENISHVIEKKNQVKNISNDFTNLQLNKINEQKKIIDNSQVQIIAKLNNQIKELEISIQLNQLYQLFQNLSQEENFKLKQFDDIEKNRMIEKKFDYQLIQQSSYKQNENCFAISFNKDASIMIAGCDNVIKVFEFRNDKLRELKQLSGHTNRVYCLQFMKKSNHFISGSADSTMIIWNLDYYNQCQCIQALRSHTSDIFCMTMNQNENVIISGSGDKTIKFWKNQNNTWSCNQSIDCQSSVYSISLNAQEDQLIASVSNNQILVIQLQDEMWMVKQNIQVEQYGFRLCHINQNQFVFQPIYGQNFQIFVYDTQDQTYKKGQELQLQKIETRDDCLFPIQYCSQIGLLIVKNGNHVHLIMKNQNGQFIVEQSINFNTHNIYGCLTEDGRYLSIWDNKSQEIQIGKFGY